MKIATKSVMHMYGIQSMALTVRYVSLFDKAAYEDSMLPRPIELFLIFTA